MTIDDVLEKLEGVKPAGSGFKAICPAHEDSSPSLSVDEGEDGNVLLKCHAGCSFEQIAKELGMNGGGKRDEQPVATYDYVDERASLLYQVLRFEPKRFQQRQPDGDGGWIWNMQGVKRVPYRLPEVIQAAQGGDFVFITEGEKDADAIKAAGFTATTSVGGSGNWRKDYARYLQGAKVVIWPDKDDQGDDYARAVRDSLVGAAAAITVVVAREGKDAYDHLVVHKLPIQDAVQSTIKSPSDVIALSEIEVKSVEWHLDQFVQVGAFHLLIGEGGIGKGAWLAWLASKITRGDTEYLQAPQNVLAVLSEDSADVDLRPRIAAAGGDTSRVFVIKKHIFLPRDLEYLEKLIEEKQAGLLIIDPVANHIGAADDGEIAVRRAINELNFVAGRTGCSIFGVRHTPKSDPSSALGSVAWVNSPRIVLLLQNLSSGARRVLSVRKSNRGTTGRVKDYYLIDTRVPGVSNRVPLISTESDYLALQAPAPKETVANDPWFQTS